MLLKMQTRDVQRGNWSHYYDQRCNTVNGTFRHIPSNFLICSDAWKYELSHLKKILDKVGIDIQDQADLFAFFAQEKLMQCNAQ